LLNSYQLFELIVYEEEMASR